MFDQKVIDLVMSVTSVKKDFYKIDAIPNKQEKNARASLRIEADQKIYVLIDFTVFGSAKNAFAICSSGIYWKKLAPDIHYISYSDLIKYSIGTNSDGSLFIKSSSFDYNISGLSANINIDVVEFCNLIKKIVEIYPPVNFSVIA